MARGLTHVRCLCEAAKQSSPILVVQASACMQAGGPWSSLLQAVLAQLRGQELVILGVPACPATLRKPTGVGTAYALSEAGCAALRKQQHVLLRAAGDDDRLLAVLAGQSRLLQPNVAAMRASALPMFVDRCALPSSSQALPLQHPMPVARPLRLAVRVIILTLPHRGDRRKEPLVGNRKAIEAMREAGFEVELLRSSCYCERDRLNARGSITGFTEDLQCIVQRRYEGSDAPVSDEDAARMRAFVDKHYYHGSDRLMNPDEGDTQGFLKDSNWPGALVCAMSHVRALVGAALAGCEYAVVFEDDAVIDLNAARRRGWCDSCDGAVCCCPSSWARCIEEAVGLMRRSPRLDLLYLGTGEIFEPFGATDGILEPGSGSDSDDDLGDLGGVTQVGYVWCAHAIVYARSALEDALALRFWELLWSQDDAIPHMFCQKPWNRRFVKALRRRGWHRRWVAGLPTRESWTSSDEDWVRQLEEFTEDEGFLNLGTAFHSSNSAEF